MTLTEPIQPHHTLADLAATWPGAARVFHRHGLDFCCRGRVALEEACGERLEANALIAEIEAEAPADERFERWNDRPLVDVIEHILERYHAPHRAELPRLVAMARKVEEVHADKASVPHGLADLLERVTDELEMHMQKEEQVLFPLVRAGRGRMAMMPIQVMEQEHEDVGRDLQSMRAVTRDYTAPDDACTTWRALYLGLEEFELELMRHIHLENNVLFPRALRA